MNNNEIALIYDRDLTKLQEEIKSFNNEENLWKTFGEIKNSSGNLALHIIGGLNYLIGTTLAQTGYLRNRDLEFAVMGIDRNVIVNDFEQLRSILKKTILSLSEDQFNLPYPIFLTKKTLPQSMF
jgi:hypothetical protein